MTDETRFGLRDGMELAGVDTGELWLRYVALGGTADADTVGRWVLGTHDCAQHDHDIVAQALNEAFLDRGHDTFPVGYADAPRQTTITQLSERPHEPPPSTRSMQARQAAAAARLRGAAAARRAVELHAEAAQLMQESGQLQFARRAKARAHVALQRAVRSLV